MAKNIMGRVNKRDQEEVEQHSNQCQANGCPLIGTGSHSTNNNHRKWICSFHINEPSTKKWDAITRSIRMNIDLYNWYAKLCELSACEFHEKKTIYYPHKYPHLAPEKTEDLFTYRARIYREFKSLVEDKHIGSSAA